MISDGRNSTSLGHVVDINPSVSIKKGKVVSFVPMDALQPFERKISNLQQREYNGGSKFQNLDTLLARITPCLENGKTAFVDILEPNEIGAGSTEFIVLRAKNDITDSKFIYYLATSPKFRAHAIQAMIGTSGRQRVQTDQLARFQFDLPTLRIQREFANILSSIDEKIELNRRMNDSLEKIGQVLFKHYFIDNPETKSWKSAKVGSLFDLTMGLSPKGGSYNFEGEGVPLLNGAADFKNGKIKPTRHTSKPTRISKIGDIIFCIRGTIGNVTIGYGQYCLGRGVAALTPNADASSYVYFSTTRAIIEMTSAASGSVIKGLSKSDISDRKILMPQKGLLRVFESLTCPLIQRLKVNADEIYVLTSLRELLLPQLMPGKIKI